MSLLLFACSSASTARRARARVNFNTELAEDERIAEQLHRSVSELLRAVVRDEVGAQHITPEDELQHQFFAKALRAIGRRVDAAPHEPLILKSYSPDGVSYLITVAFFRGGGAAPEVDKILELHAYPDGDGYRFRCPFAFYDSLPTVEVGGITYHGRLPLDVARAEAFARFKANLDRELKVDPRPLDYYRFDSLDHLLKAHGIVYDCRKCNSLAHDLGFLDDGGNAFLTGTGDERYIFGFVRDYLGLHFEASELYAPLVNGMAAYYGGYGLSGDDMATLKGQLRARLAEDPDFDFLREYRLGRRSSVQRHFTNYVLGALLFEAAVESRGFAHAMQLVRSGANGDRFFANLRSVLATEESGFHELIVRLIG